MWCVYIIGIHLHSGLSNLTTAKHASFYIWVVYIVKQMKSFSRVKLANSTQAHCHAVRKYCS